MNSNSKSKANNILSSVDSKVILHMVTHIILLFVYLNYVLCLITVLSGFDVERCAGPTKTSGIWKNFKFNSPDFGTL